MKRKKYKLIVYFIAITIAATIGLQLYWNIENYKSNKQRLINEVQIALDNGIEAYYADLTRTTMITLIDTDSNSTNRVNRFMKALDFTRKKDSLGKHKGSFDFGKISMLDIESDSAGFAINPLSSVQVFKGKKADSMHRIEGLLNKIVISYKNDSLDFNKLNTFFDKELDRKKIGVRYGFVHSSNDSIKATFKAGPKKGHWLSTYSKSTYLPTDEKLELMFSNPTFTVLKRSLTGILLSLVLSASIIFCLLYLLRTINKQKELAEIKNDLISNITHEFKTPISTVSTAIEGIKNFTKSGDLQKTNKYLDIGNQQLKKLHLMVEKLLETATLDSDKLLLSKKTVDLVHVLKTISEKHQMLAENKEILFTANISELEMEVDPFHFENALTNLIDNAIKYGGNLIEVNLNSLLSTIEITVADNGTPIEKPQREKIFDKFYRIPTGNRHDVKGFGIGLFYTKKIIEKHGGNIMLVPNAKNTIFKVTL